MSKIIAEIGINWCGDLEIAKEMILQSKRAGADFVKFQMFNYDTIKGSKYEVELSDMILHYDQLNMLRGYAFQQNIGFGVSVMYPEAFDSIREIGVILDFIKIRCKDHANEKIARPSVRYCDEFDIPLLVSSESPLTGDYFLYNLYNTPHANNLYCVSKYPPELSDIYSSYINHDMFDGYSNHFPSPYPPILAVSRDLEFVEVHVMRRTHNSSSISLGYAKEQLDSNVSIDFDDLKEVCNFNKIMSQMR